MSKIEAERIEAVAKLLWPDETRPVPDSARELATQIDALYQKPETPAREDIAKYQATQYHPQPDELISDEEQKTLKENILEALNENYILKAKGETDQDCIVHDIMVSVEDLLKFSIYPRSEAQHAKDQEEFAKEKELMFNPDWKPDVQAILKEHNEAVAQIKAEHEQKVKEIFEAIEREFGYFSDSGLEKIIIDDGGYYGNPGSLEKYQALKGGK